MDDDQSYSPTIKSGHIGTMSSHWNNQMHDWSNTNSPKCVMLRGRQKQYVRPSPPNLSNLPNMPNMPNMQNMVNWGPQPAWSMGNSPAGVHPTPYPPMPFSLSAVSSIPSDVLDTKLSTLSVAGVCKLFDKIDELNPSLLTQYTTLIKQNNINGRVLLHCDLDELKKVCYFCY